MENKFLSIILTFAVIAGVIDYANIKNWEYSEDGLYEYSLKDQHNSIKVTVKNCCEDSLESPQIHFASSEPVHKFDVTNQRSDMQHYTIWSNSWNKEWKSNEQHTFTVTFDQDVDTSCLSDFILLYNYDNSDEDTYTHSKYAYNEQYDPSKDNTRIPDPSINISNNLITTDMDPMTMIVDSVYDKSASVYNLEYVDEEGWDAKDGTKRVCNCRLDINGITVGEKLSDIDFFKEEEHDYSIRYYLVNKKWIQSDYFYEEGGPSDIYIHIDIECQKDNTIQYISVIYVNEAVPPYYG